MSFSSACNVFLMLEKALYFFLKIFSCRRLSHFLDITVESVFLHVHCRLKLRRFSKWKRRNFFFLNF